MTAGVRQSYEFVLRGEIGDRFALLFEGMELVRIPWVDYKNDDRAPLLFISGSTDHLMPPAIQQSNAKHYKSENTITEIKEFEGPHLLPSGDGWEEVADYALDWALSHAREGAPQSA